jgi:2-polyprenyl-3-methyl-5-hydroxy-6-metoxy-1,4-benzoquinol methylase
MWDERYATEDYVYGTEPNDFLVSMSDRLPVGRTLCVAEGEGRNAVWLAGQGHEVTAVDASKVGLAKAQKLAGERGVNITTEVVELGSYLPEPRSYDLIVSIYAHLPRPARLDFHPRIVEALKPGGMLVLEAYTPDQLKYGTGGPPDVEKMMSLEVLRDELSGLDFVYAVETVRDVREGSLHTGEGAVVQVVAVKPG